LSTFKFSKISIIESLGDEDKKTGKELYSDIKLLALLPNKGLKIEFKKISTKDELINHVKSLIQDAKYNCIFRMIPAADSGDVGHPFRLIPATDSGRSRPPIPTEVGHP
jgi:hypothetical protein